MTEEDRDSRLHAWLLLVTFVVLCTAGHAAHVALDMAHSGRFEILERSGMLLLSWYWLQAQCRPHRVAFPLDMGMFLGVAWVLVLPYYMWRYQRWRGLAKVGAIALLHLVATIGVMLVRLVMFHLSEPSTE